MIGCVILYFTFVQVVWRARTDNNDLVLSHISPDGDENYPGEVKVEVRYQLTNLNELIITFTATTNKATPINLTSHAYFNLAAEVSRLIKI